MAHFEIFNFARARLDSHTGPGLVMSICVYSPDGNPNGNPFMRVCPGLAYAHEQLYFGDNTRRLHVVGIEYRGDCVGLRTYKQLLELGSIGHHNSIPEGLELTSISSYNGKHLYASFQVPFRSSGMLVTRKPRLLMLHFA